MNRALTLPDGYPRAPLKNGINRTIGQLLRVTLKFCKTQPASRGVRQFIEQDVLNFSRANPGVAIYLKPRRHHAPQIVSEYLNGERHHLVVYKFTNDAIWKFMHHLNNRVGIQNTRLRKNYYTVNPSIQGVWSPFTNRDPKLNIMTFPREDFSLPEHIPETATERLRNMYKKQIIKESSDKEREGFEMPVQS